MTDGIVVKKIDLGNRTQFMLYTIDVDVEGNEQLNLIAANSVRYWGEDKAREATERRFKELINEGKRAVIAVAFVQVIGDDKSIRIDDVI